MAKRLREARKAKFVVRGDIFPSLINRVAHVIAPPLSDIYNTISRSLEWPNYWKTEFVTAIPKKPHPQNTNDLRNISCTPFLSKTYESFVLDWHGKQTSLRTNQYGGVKGCRTEHFLVEMWQTVLENLDDNRAASFTTSIDYSKAFSRCLGALKAKGASSQLLGIVGSFLSNRTMLVNFENIHTDGYGFKTKHAKRTQNLFWRIVSEAEACGMKVNAAKTQTMCISEVKSYNPSVFFFDRDGNRTQPSNKMHILGVTFSSQPDMAIQAKAVIAGLQARIWSLSHLAHHGLSESDLLQVYKSSIRPVHDYCSCVYNSSLTITQSNALERLQAKALKIYTDMSTLIVPFCSAQVSPLSKSGGTTIASSPRERPLQILGIPTGSLSTPTARAPDLAGLTRNCSPRQRGSSIILSLTCGGGSMPLA